jgi:hypothetical protein
MSSSDASEITGLGLEQVVGEIPAAVFVIEAPSGRMPNDRSLQLVADLR